MFVFLFSHPIQKNSLLQRTVRTICKTSPKSKVLIDEYKVIKKIYITILDKDLSRIDLIGAIHSQLKK